MKNLSSLLLIPLLLLLGMGSANAQHDFKKVDDWLEKNTAEMGGRSILLIYQDGQIVHQYAVNKMNMQQKMLINFLAKRNGDAYNTNDYTPTTRQPIASCSKWLSAALIMTFVDEGKLKLTDTVGKFLPVLSKSGKGKITISQCLSHQTGINPASLKQEIAEMRTIKTMDDAMTDIAKQPMEGEPGKVFHYSNAGLQIAGAVIEKIGGKTFQQLFAERIARPLNMMQTDFGQTKVAMPAGGGISTAADYINFLTMILNKGTFNGQRILSENSIAEMQINRLTPDVKIGYSPAEAGNFGYGYGEWTMDKGSVTSPGLFGSFPWVDNNRHYAVYLMTFYIRNEGRNQRYKALKKLVDEALQ